MGDRATLIKRFKSISFMFSKAQFTPNAARIGKQHSKITWIEETALNLLKRERNQ